MAIKSTVAPGTIDKFIRPIISTCNKKINVVHTPERILAGNIKTAELWKGVENTYRDINIAFANELIKICRSENIDVWGH